MLMFFQHHAALVATIEHAEWPRVDTLSTDIATELNNVILENKMETKIQVIETRSKQNPTQVFDKII